MWHLKRFSGGSKVKVTEVHMSLDNCLVDIYLLSWKENTTYKTIVLVKKCCTLFKFYKDKTKR